MSVSDSFPWLSMLLGQLASQLPIIIVCLVGVVFVLVRWKQNPRGSPWAFGGFGLTLILSFVTPVFYAILQARVQRGGVENMTVVYSIVGIMMALLHALGYAMLLVAFFAGRSQSTLPATPGPRA